MRRLAVTTVILVLFGSLLAYVYLIKQDANAQVGGGRGATGPIPVETMRVTEGDISKSVTITGPVIARTEVEVYAKQSGEIVELSVDKGDSVQQGQILARIDPVPFEIQLRQAAADLASAEAAYGMATDLSEVSSKINLDRAKADAVVADAAIEQTKIGLKQDAAQAGTTVKRSSADLQIAKARLASMEAGARDQEIEQTRLRVLNSKREVDRLKTLSQEEFVTLVELETAQQQYDIYLAQLSLLEAGARSEDIDALKGAVHSAEAVLESAQTNERFTVELGPASLISAQARANNAKADLEQAQITEDKAVWQKELAQAEAAFRKAQAAFDLATRRLDETYLRAPVSGVVSQRFLDRGGTAMTNQPFVSIVGMDTVRVAIRVPEREVAYIQQNAAAVVRPDAFPSRRFEGKVVFVSPIINRESQTAEAEIEVSNRDHTLKPGMFARVDVTVAEPIRTIVLPTDVISQGVGESYVYVVTNAKAVKTPITLGMSEGDKTEVRAGLRVGDKIVIMGQAGLTNGADVNPVNQDTPPPTTESDAQDIQPAGRE